MCVMYAGVVDYLFQKIVYFENCVLYFNSLSLSLYACVCVCVEACEV